jgi:hypothetical protein
VAHSAAAVTKISSNIQVRTKNRDADYQLCPIHVLIEEDTKAMLSFLNVICNLTTQKSPGMHKFSEHI